MAHVCPGCGSDVAFPSRATVLLEGTCPACGKASLIIEEGGAVPASGDAAPVASPALPCGQCGEPLTLRAGPRGSIETHCMGCAADVRYVPARARERGPPTGPFRGGPPRGRDDRMGRPPSRPCRECGGPLQFSTDDEGRVVGECSSCGNRFTLPPREDRPFRAGPRGGPRREWTPRERGRGPPRYPPRGRRYDRDDGDSAGEERRRRRRGPPSE
jgi:hypothetical protein